MSTDAHTEVRPSSRAAASRRTWLMAAVAGGAGLAGVGWAVWRSPSAAADPAVQAFWALTLQTPEGAPVPLNAYAGKALLVNFWATWCPPCVRELPMLSAFSQAHPGVQVLGIAVDKPEAVQKFVARQPLHFPVVMAGAGGSALTRSLGNAQGGLPFSILFDANAHVKQRKIGEISDADLQQWIASL